ncbi:MAG: hypothetical protein NDI82_08375 [Anaeromyxobacteraceae bacterium]|nr:hypothetical protein [Anaeromyxobacteraceae bacterium]
MRRHRSATTRRCTQVWLGPLALLLAAVPAAALVPNVPPAADPRLYAPPSVQPEASHFACSVDTLVSGADCILESDAPAASNLVAQAKDNVALAASLSAWACNTAARAPGEPAADREVMAQCERAFKEKAQACSADGVRALLDVRRRFAPEARACYAGLGAALAATRTMAAVAVPCCRCLTAARCFPVAHCASDLLVWPLPAKAAACLRESCASACRTFVPEPSPAGEPAKPGPPPCWNPFHPENRCERI